MHWRSDRIKALEQRFPDAVLALSLDEKINSANTIAGRLIQKLNGEHGLPLAIEEEVVGKVLKGAPG
jgi:hypothetical protein